MAMKDMLGANWLEELRANIEELYQASLTILATDEQALAKASTAVALTPANLAALGSSETFAGLLEIATDVEAAAKTATDKGLVPSNLAALGASETLAGLIEIATSAETITGTDTGRAVTPAGLTAALDAVVKRGVHTVTSGEETAGTLDIVTGLTGATGQLVQIYRSGVEIHADAAISLSSGTLTVADGSATYSVTEGDLIVWEVF
jgi:hypothetical protein